MLLSLPFLIVLGVLLPLFGYLGLMHSKAGAENTSPAPTTVQIVIQLCVLQTIVVGLAVLAMYGAQVRVGWLPVISIHTVLVAITVLGIVVLLSLFEARRPLGPNEQVRARLREVSARDPAWIGGTIYAGIVEELAYRGVLTLLLATYFGYWPAAAASAILFGLAHLSSGWRAVPIGAVFALAMQYLVFVSDGLLLAVAVHIVYDLIATWLGQKVAEPRNDSKVS